MDSEKDMWQTPTGQRIFETNDKQFLSLHAAADFTGLKKEILQRHIAQNKISKDDFIEEDKYIFISLSYLETVRDQTSRIKHLIHLEEVHQVKIKEDDFAEFVKWKLKQKAEKLSSKNKKASSKSKKQTQKPTKKDVSK